MKNQPAKPAAKIDLTGKSRQPHRQVAPLNLKTNTRQANWRRAFPDRYQAHVAVQGAIGRGDLIKGPCEVCGVTEADGALIDGHHDDYSKPLDVRWLCRQHHMRLHNGGEDLFIMETSE